MKELLDYYQRNLFTPFSEKFNIDPVITDWDEFQILADEIIITMQNGVELPFELN